MICVHLTDEERQELRLRARREVGRVSERIRFVLLSDQGYSPNSVQLFHEAAPAAALARATWASASRCPCS